MDMQPGLLTREEIEAKTTLAKNCRAHTAIIHQWRCLFMCALKKKGVSS